MRKPVAFVLAGSLGVVGLVGCDDGTSDSSSAGEKVERAVDRAGDAIARGADKTGDALNKAADKTGEVVGRGVDQASEAGREVGAKLSQWADATVSDAARIRDTLSSTTEAALARDRLNDVVDRLAEADRTRIGRFGDEAMREFNERADKVRSQWQAKYNTGFDIRDENTVFGNAKITTAQEGDRKQAKVVLPATGSAPEVTLNLVNEGTAIDAWRIDVPDTLTTEQLRDNLLRQVKKVEESAASWPAEVNDGYRVVAQQVLSAMTDANAGVAAAN